MYTDNPLRVAGPDELPSDRLERSESMADVEYEGLIDDCASIVKLGQALEAQRAEPMPENIFDRARRLNGDGKQESREHQLFTHAAGGYYGV